MSRKTVDTEEFRNLANLLRTGRCQGCGGLIREQVKCPDDVGKLLFERDRRNKLIGIRCPKCAGYVKAITRERYF